MSVRVLVGDALTVLRTLPSASVHMCVTSPPYYGLRDYGTALWDGGDAECDHLMPVGPSALNAGFNERWGHGSGAKKQEQEAKQRQYVGSCNKCGATRIDKQIGLEATPELWVAAMVAVFREVRRVLRPDGTAWINCGDAYNSGTSARRKASLNNDVGYWNAGGDMGDERINVPGLKPKDLIGLPWMLAFALRADGWYLRSEIIWSKPNPMPESVTDRPTKAHEQLFLLSKARTYFYDADAIREEAEYGFRNHSAGWRSGTENRDGHRSGGGSVTGGDPSAGRNKRSVWTVATEAFPESHFATYPTALIEPCIKAGTSERGVCPECGAPWVRVVERSERVRPLRQGKYTDTGANHTNRVAGTAYEALRQPDTTTGWRPSCAHPGEPVPATVLDCFGGAGTTALVADRLGRNSILVELNPAYAEMARRRINGEAPLFADVSVA